jgi:hypothetical protein
MIYPDDNGFWRLADLRLRKDGRRTAMVNLSMKALSHLFHSLSKVLFTFPSRYL